MIPSQAAIETHVGIDDDIARHMMAMKTPAAKSAMNLLKMQCRFYDHGGMALLQQAVLDCRREIKAAKAEEAGS